MKIEKPHLPEQPDNNRDDTNEQESEAMKKMKIEKEKLQSSIHAKLNDFQDTLEASARESFFEGPESRETKSSLHPEVQNQDNDLRALFEEPLKTSLFYASGRIPVRKIGQNLLSDFSDLGIGLSDSLISVAKLGAHLIFDTAKFIRHPVQEFRKTKEIFGTL